jgi:NarL family two-component system response regulator LiaR
MDNIKILLAEDHVVVRQGTRQLLECEPDLKVIGEAGDGEKAVQLAAQLRPDVIIMDVAMPKLSGIEATKQIKALLPSVAILVLSGYDYDEYVFSLLEAGAAGYLLKSASGDELIDAIRAVHKGDSVLHPTVARKVVDRFRHLGKPEGRASDLLTEREMDVLKAAAKGMSNKDIGKELRISVRTVQAHLRSIFNKLGVGSRSEAVIYGLKRGWVTIEEIP